MLILLYYDLEGQKAVPTAIIPCCVNVGDGKCFFPLPNWLPALLRADNSSCQKKPFVEYNSKFYSACKIEPMLHNETLEKAYQQWYKTHSSIVAGKKACLMECACRNWYSTCPTEKCKLYDLVLGLHSRSQDLHPWNSLSVSNMETLTHECLRSQSKVWNETCIYLRIYFLAELEGHYHRFSAFKLISTVTIRSFRSEIIQNFFKEKQIKFHF